MLVKNLIAALEKLPLDATIMLYDHGDGGWGASFDNIKIFQCEKDFGKFALGADWHDQISEYRDEKNIYIPINSSEEENKK